MSVTSEILAGYLEAALWSSTIECDAEGIMRDGLPYGLPADDWLDVSQATPETVAQARADIAAFLELPGVWDALCEHGPWADDNSYIGHDFWLTRNRHGAGFWDRGAPDAICDLLTNATQTFGEAWVGPDSDDVSDPACTWSIY